MDGAPLVRLRWRLHGAWMWPTFVVLTVADGAVGHLLPLSGDSQSPVTGWLIGVFLCLVGIIAVAPAIAFVLRRVRRDMPKVVARDYAGTIVVLGVSLALLAAGLAHHPAIGAARADMQDATARAQAFIGDRAPPQFIENLGRPSVYELQANRIYRVCVESRVGTRSWCVVVDRSKPFGRSVRFAGSESNQALSQGTW